MARTYTFSEQLGARMREYREKANLTQRELGDKLGKSYGAIAHYEVGDRQIYADYVHDFCKVMGITMEELFRGL